MGTTVAHTRYGSHRRDASRMAKTYDNPRKRKERDAPQVTTQRIRLFRQHASNTGSSEEQNETGSGSSRKEDRVGKSRRASDGVNGTRWRGGCKDIRSRYHSCLRRRAFTSPGIGKGEEHGVTETRGLSFHSYHVPRFLEDRRAKAAALPAALCSHSKRGQDRPFPS